MWLVAEPWPGAVEVQWCSGACAGRQAQPRSCESAGPVAGSQGQGCAGHFSGYAPVCRGGTWQHQSKQVEHILTPVGWSGYKRLTRPRWSSIHGARFKNARSCWARVLTRWRWWRKDRLESNVTPSSLRYSATAIAVPPNVSGGSGGCWQALEMTRSWLLAGSNLMRHCLPQLCRLSRVCCNTATFFGEVISECKSVHRGVISKGAEPIVRDQAPVYVSNIQWERVLALARYLEEHRHVLGALQKFCPQTWLGDGGPPGSHATRQSGMLWHPFAGACGLFHYAIFDQTPQHYPLQRWVHSRRFRPSAFIRAEARWEISRDAALTEPILTVRKEVVAIQEGKKLTVHDGFHDLW